MAISERKQVAELCGVLGRKVRQLRRAAGYTQAGLAEALDVQTETVNRLERGALVPSLRLLIKAGGILGVPVKELFEDERTLPTVGDGAEDIRVRRIARRVRSVARTDLPLLEAFVGRLGRDRSAKERVRRR